MENNLNITENIDSGIQFPRKLLSVVWYIGIIGATLSVIPMIVSIKDFPIETTSTIGGFMTSLAELIFISLIAYKLNKDRVQQPSYLIVGCFAGVIALDLIVSLISEEVGFITTIIYLIFTAIMGFIFLTAQATKKIGTWLLLSIAGSIILMSIIANDFETTQKVIAIAVAAIFVGPYAIFLGYCQDFLTGKEND